MTASTRALELVAAAATAADERSGFDLVALDVSGRLPLTDVFLIASGRNERMVLSIAEEIEEALHKLGQKALRREGRELGRWVLLDFGDLIVHVFHEEDREFYGLERLWNDAPIVPLNIAGPNPAGVGAGEDAGAADVSMAAAAPSAAAGGPSAAGASDAKHAEGAESSEA